MTDVILIIIIAAVMVFALKGSIAHMRGEGGCCGGGKVPKAARKKLEGRPVGVKEIMIDGMHCENCRNRAERCLNQLDGVAAKVNLQKHMAVVTMTREVPDEELEHAVTGAGFTVTGIRAKEA